MIAQDPVVIIGAGPAGLGAAKVLADAGLRPVVIDEGRQPGGQIFRMPQFQLSRDLKTLYGFDALRAQRFRNDVAAVEPAIDYRPNTLVWAAERGTLHLVRQQQVTVQSWSRLIIATGATDRIIPMKGWTTPGVFSLGGAQIVLKAEAAMIGRRVVFVGTGPLLYLVAYQYARAGAKVCAVLETGKPFDDFTLLPNLMSGGAIFAKGLYYIAWLRARGIQISTGVVPVEVTATKGEHASGLFYLHRGRKRHLSCDAVAVGYGLKAETQVADLVGLDFHFNHQHRQWLPVADTFGRSSLRDVYMAGDGLAIRGSEIAALSGRVAATALLNDAGYSHKRDADSDRRAIQRYRRFRGALDRAFAYPHHIAAGLPDEVVVCRCEGLTAGGIRHAVSTTGEADINRIKAFCRVGMGRCQGRLCGQTAAELIAASTSIDIERVGRLRGQAPIKPVALSDLAVHR